MSLFSATLLTGAFLIIASIFLVFKEAATETALKAFPRSKGAMLLFMTVAIVCFSMRIYNLSASDFGDYKEILLLIFLGITLASFYFVPDFLGVRALAGCILLSADVLLDAAYLQDPSSRLFLVSFVYLMIIIAFILGGSPYLMRDAIQWLYKSSLRNKLLGYALGAYGLILTVAAFTY